MVAAAETSSKERAMTNQSEDAIAQRRYEQARPRQEVSIDPVLLDGYVGYYQLAPGAILSITRNTTRLFAQLTGQQAIELFPESDHEFFSKIVVAQITFAADGRGPANHLVLHQNGYERVAKRIDEGDAKKVAAELDQRVRENTPIVGSDDALRGHIEAMRQGRPNYEQMSEMLAQAVHRQFSMAQNDFASLEELLSISFKGVGRGGEDIYDVQFANGITEWRIVLTPDGKIYGLSYRNLP
jgi:Domain of unknown function (DUF3471)